jgi:acetyl-CoA carboxylase biotin carboxyl carrier protein
VTGSVVDGSPGMKDIGAIVRMIVDSLPGPLRRVRVQADGCVVEVEWNTDGTVGGEGTGREREGPAAVARGPAGASKADANASVADAAEIGPRPITALVVGTFYRRPSPEAPPFVEVGDPVEAGQQVATIETMKLFTPVTAQAAGRVVAIHAEDGEMVEFGQPLLDLSPVG